MASACSSSSTTLFGAGGRDAVDRDVSSALGVSTLATPPPPQPPSTTAMRTPTTTTTTSSNEDSNGINPDPHPSPHVPRRIRPLPKDVIDRIAAGEVVQRPASLAKELIENSLDADGTCIDIQCTSGGMNLLSVTDDGVGIPPADLALAATRFATSKLVRFDDLRSIRTFGFRGEALASASMVGRLTITSRRRQRGEGGTRDKDDDSGGSGGRSSGYSFACAYKQTYRDGAPVSPKPSPAAGKEGTVVKVEDLFHNVPSRRRAFAGARREADEYARILAVAQRYAVKAAADGVGFVCRKRGGNADLNTQSIVSVKKVLELRKRRRQKRGAVGGGFRPSDDAKNDVEADAEAATRDVVGHVFGSAVARELLVLRSEEGDVDAVSLAALRALSAEAAGEGGGKGGAVAVDMMLDASAADGGDDGCGGDAAAEAPTKAVGRFSFAYRAFGLLTNGSYCAPKSSAAFVLFINGRLVESAPLRRAVEGVYADSLPKGAKPFVYLSLELPGPHVDVNVHPTKREVAFLHEDTLCDALARATRDVLGSAQESRTFYAQALLPQVMENSSDSTKTRRIDSAGVSSDTNGVGVQGSGHVVTQEGEERAQPDKLPADSSDEAGKSLNSLKRYADSVQNTTPSKKRYDPTKLVRTNSAAPSGALEPFLVPTQSQSAQILNCDENQSTPGDVGNGGGTQDDDATTSFRHADDCDFAKGTQTVDLTKPGAFAAICRCQIERGHTLPAVPRQGNAAAAASSGGNSNGIFRPRRIVPSDCSYSSIRSLRADVTSRAHRELSTKLRDSTFVGPVSRQRSLIQWGIELLMIQHFDLGKELFYQLALNRFGDVPAAELGGGGVNVKTAIEHVLQFEEDVASGVVEEDADAVEISETNAGLAEQATQCLREKARMLGEYFSIRLEERADPERDGENELILTALPILLEGHSPPPHALPLFLLRLATEVNWTEERPCFQCVCSELGSFYAEIPFADEIVDGADGSDEFKESDGEERNGSQQGTSSDIVDEAAKRYIKHTLFPAISYLLVPPREFATDGTVVKLALLSSLYKVFERC